MSISAVLKILTVFYTQVCIYCILCTELFGDALAEADSKLAELVDGIGDDDDPEMHKSFRRAAHALKGQAFTLGLGKMGRTCELLEKWICSVEEAVRAGVAIKDDARLQLWLSRRKPLVELVRAQFQELRDYLPAVKEKAAAEVPTEDAEDATADT